MIADVDIRLATLADAAGIAALSRDDIETGLPWGWRPERVVRAMRDPDTNVAVVSQAGALVGFGIMSYREEDAHLLLLAVRAGSRRKGIGSALLVWLEEAARAAGSKCIRLEARRDRDPAREFYNEHGYYEQQIETAMYGGAVDGVLMIKWLRDPLW